MSRIDWKVFASLHDGRASYAEKLDKDELKTLHIRDIVLEEGIIALLNRGCRVYLTGNPGDGKTHLIQYLVAHEGFPAATELILDASATHKTHLLHQIEQAQHNSKPALIAINEGPLRALVADLPLADSEALAAQLVGRTSEVEEVALIPLNARPTLGSMFRGALDHLLNKVDFESAPEKVQANIRALREPRVQERLTTLLRLVAQGGVQPTMHQLLGLLAKAALGKTDYYDAFFQLPRTEASPLDRELRALDPADFVHAHHDTHGLWDAPRELGIWLANRMPKLPNPGLSRSEQKRQFRSLKRQFYFENTLGDELLMGLPQDRQSFSELLNQVQTLAPLAATKVWQQLRLLTGAQSADSDIWPLYQTHRYDTDAPATAAVAGALLRADDVTVSVPTLPWPAVDLIEYEPSYLTFTLLAERWRGSDQPVPTLRIDLPVWRELSRVAAGMPAAYASEEVQRRVGAFRSALTTGLPPTADRVWVLNLETGAEEYVRLVQATDGQFTYLFHT
ncbi:hypothetical protein [Hymenobacter sp. HDW8]|uniref:hypothetical protein n=1 Tax=Hymenobacter sp. HDW8 TaxID=2714932 RepID=UPI00140BA568|nr:hypothetical protein [Hymenobacter sp. HDW8]QIL78388.1 hypothetical protein G7064_21440 [Hymenobacter sp. HDW8]